MFHLYLKDLGKLPESIMLVYSDETEPGQNEYNAYETFRVTDYLDCEICEIRNRGGYHTVYVWA